MRALLLLTAIAACDTTTTPACDAGPDATPEDWNGWGAFCDRPIYGAVACVGPNDQPGACVNVEGWNRCELGCSGVDYECSMGCRHFFEGNECYCLPCDR